TLIDDLQLLFVTGRPGHMPDDLIDASWEGGQIFISNAEEVSVPVRLSAEEAGILVLASTSSHPCPGSIPRPWPPRRRSCVWPPARICAPPSTSAPSTPTSSCSPHSMRPSTTRRR